MIVRLLSEHRVNREAVRKAIAAARRPTLAWIGDGGEREHVVRDSQIVRPSAGGGSGAPVINIAAGAFPINYPIMNDPRALLMLRQVVGQALIEGAAQTRRL
jgi:hypothetical protein